MDNVDVCVVGGGPAGMTAAAMASEYGLTVTLLDERPSAGGQIYRGLEDGPFRNSGALGLDYPKGLSIIERFRSARVDALFSVNLWRIDMVDNGGIVTFSKDKASHRIGFNKLILATGALERPFAFEGWTLPGVMSVGAAQLLLKSSNMVPSGRIVLVGNGPLLLLFASQLIALGVQISAILDTGPKVGKIATGLRHFDALLRNVDKLFKGAGMMRNIRSAGIAGHRNVSALSAFGEGSLSSVTFEADGKRGSLDADTLLVHEGVIPNTQLSRALKCLHVWDDNQRCLRPQVDHYGESSVPNVFVVGDGAAIDGAVAAPASAEIAVGRILEKMGRANAQSRAAVSRAAAIFEAERRFRPFLDALYTPRIADGPISDDTLICRCEEVSAKNLRAAVRDGAIGLAQAKVFTRCGMGPCQGRICGPIVSRLIGEETGRGIADTGGYNIRFPLKPVTLAELAGFADEEGEDEAHHAA
jgi:NADPH-dependent 2,4-dienoyl-CoA reductase/sulfur reductase-like enzyme